MMASSLPMFHSRTGSLITLSNNNHTAQRNHPSQEFNNGVVLSAEPLRDNQIFEVTIDKKVNSWSGSIEIGVTVCEPSNLNFPFSAAGFRDGIWVMSGMSILCDGHSMIEDYGCDLDQLKEGDRVGIMRTSEGVLHFFVNGTDQGPAATDIPPIVYAVIDLYGKCAQVSTSDPNGSAARENDVLSTCNEMVNELANNESSAFSGQVHEFLTEISNQIANDLANDMAQDLSIEQTTNNSDEESGGRDILRFHERCGNLVKLSNGRRTAERRRPLDEFNNGVVMTNRPIKDGEVFEIRLDRLVDKWSGSIEVGITTHNPNNLEFPATMTNMRNASANRTIMMSGCGILTNGKGTRREYGQFNLDELSEGDYIGLVRKSNGHLHYFINGHDQGMAASNSPSPVWGVVDLYGMAVKVTIVDQNPVEVEETNVAVGPNRTPQTSSIPLQPGERSVVNTLRQFLDSCGGSGGSSSDQPDSRGLTETEEVEKLLFSPVCGAHAAVINGGRSAHRPNASEDFNNGVILTSRILRPTEVFEVRIDKLVDKWAGSIEIGLTTHQPSDLDFPSTMTNIRSGTWMMTGNGVMHNGTTIIEDYGQNLDRLKVGDRVGVIRKADGTIHFFVNGIDQGGCATSVPASVYGVIDLYGQAAQASIVDIHDALSSPDTDSSLFTDPDQLKFHHLHGRNAAIHHNGLTASRPNACGEFNDAIIMSNRPLRDGELFEIVLEKMVDRWSGSLEAGVTLVKPEDIDFPSTMTDIEHGTWMLSGSAIMQDGATIRNGYPLDLDSLTTSQRIGMMRCPDGTLHYFLNGVDQGVACTDIASGVYAVIDLYGQCAQVTMSCGTIVMPPSYLVQQTTSQANIAADPQSSSSLNNVESSHRLSKCCGKNISLRNSCWGASRTHGYNHGIVFSSDPLKYDEIFEIELTEVSNQWSDSLKIGLTSMAISDTSSPINIPSTATELTSKITWIVAGSEVRKCGVVIKENYSPSLQRLEVGDKVGVCRRSDGTMHVLLNGDDLGEAASGIPKNVFAVIDLHGSVEGIDIVSSILTESSSVVVSPVYNLDVSIQDIDQDNDTSAHLSTSFHHNHGKNILLRESGTQAERLASYNNSIVVGNKPLRKRKLFQVRLGKPNAKWSSSLMVGVMSHPVDKFVFPASATAITKSTIIIQGESIFFSGQKVKDHFGPNLDCLGENSRVGILLDEESCLHLVVNGIDQGIAARDVPTPCWPLVDLYGQCQQVTILPDSFENPAASGFGEEREKADLEDKGKENLHPDSNLGSRNCEYLNLCNRLKSNLGLPDGYFEGFNMCFCSSCYKVRGDGVQRGDPPKDFVLPFGWCRYILRAPNKAHSLNVAEKWHSAYNGMCVTGVRRVLDTFDLIPSDDSFPNASILLPKPHPYTEKSRPESLGGKQIYLSPTIRRAGGNQFSPKYRFTDPKSKKCYDGRVALQVWVKPGSYKVSPQCDEDKAQVDPHFKNSEIDWVTKERGSTMIHALLLKVE